jgi:hypothetical protein
MSRRSKTPRMSTGKRAIFCRVFGCPNDADADGLCESCAAAVNAGRPLDLAEPLPPKSKYRDEPVKDKMTKAEQKLSAQRWPRASIQRAAAIKAGRCDVLRQVPFDPKTGAD